jgi:putative phage-type endonuclease
MNDMTQASVIPQSEGHWLELRAQNINSTEISALFGCSPYMTEFELWHNKKNAVVGTSIDNERVKWGTRLEHSIAAGIAEDQGWVVEQMKEYLSNPHLRIGSSFDYIIKNADGTPHGLLEIKNVDGLVYKNTWVENEDGSIEAPLHIELQVQHQMLLSNAPLAYIGALVGGNRVVLTKRERNEKVINGILERVIKFWQSINADQPPTPDFTKDSEYIISALQYAEPNKVVDASADADIAALAEEYRALGEVEKSAATKRSEIKARILLAVGDAEKVLGNGFSISLGMVGPADVSYRRDGYRGFRLHWKKQK